MAEIARILAAVVDVASDETLEMLARPAAKEMEIVEDFVRDQAQRDHVAQEGVN
jgi:hypothetical protein